MFAVEIVSIISFVTIKFYTIISLCKLFSLFLSALFFVLGENFYPDRMCKNIPLLELNMQNGNV
uniref:Uncharacterized protein n=1 Tax=Rhizophora mucronata TaxID=61149 RepID=A0A2P2PKL3_RHIMU